MLVFIIEFSIGIIFLKCRVTMWACLCVLVPLHCWFDLNLFLLIVVICICALFVIIFICPIIFEIYSRVSSNGCCWWWKVWNLWRLIVISFEWIVNIVICLLMLTDISNWSTAFRCKCSFCLFDTDIITSICNELWHPWIHFPIETNW